MKLLVVEDSDADFELIRRSLRGEGGRRYDVRHAECLGDGLASLESNDYDVVLLDLSLPDSSGIETLKAVLEQDGESTPPVVVMTGLADEDLASLAVKVGAQDYLVKGDISTGQLVRTLRHAVERHRLVMELVEANRKAQFLASHCGLTGLPNRNLLMERLTEAVADAKRNNEHIALLFLDLDRFKPINDSLGHAAGDELLRIVGERLRSVLRVSDIASRLGGDEFVVLLARILKPTDVAIVAEKVVKAISAPVHLSGHEVSPGLSVGIAVYPNDGETPETLIANADAAMYEAKQQGNNSYRYFTSDMNRASIERIELERDLKRACDQEEFILHYQPIVVGETGRIVGAEALVRWAHPSRGLVSPAEFIPAAEETGLIARIGEWVLEQACRQASNWLDQGLDLGHISVNVSPRQFSRGDFHQLVGDALDASGLAGPRLNLEITESCLIGDVEAAKRTLLDLRDLGVRVSLDDFGTGFSSLSALKRLPIDRLKIDRCFVVDAASDRDGAAIIRAIIALAGSLGLETVAEGVETEEQLAFMLEHGCPTIQGFYFSPAIEAAAFGELLKSGRVRPKVTRTG